MSIARWCQLLLLCATLAVTRASLAQDKAFIEGDVAKVVNGQGVSVPGVVLTLQNKQLQNESQGILRTYSSDSDGRYRFFDLTPSDDYVISATAGSPFECWFPSFDKTQKYASQKFSVTVGEKKYMLPPAICEPQAVSAPAAPPSPPSSGGPADPTASADADPQQTPSPGPPSPAPPATAKQSIAEPRPIFLDTLSTSMSTVISSEQLRTLPLYNRNFLALGLLSISTHDVQAGSTLAGASFSISGQQPTSNDFLLDGMNNLASSNNQAIPFQVNDAIQEFRVAYANPDAQFGRNVGGAVNIVTQHGTSNFHGSVFGFFNSASLNANSPLSVYSNSGFAQGAAYAGSLNSAPAPAYEPFGEPIYEPATYNQYVATVKALGQNCTTPGATLASPQCYQLFDPAVVLAGHDSHYQPFSSQQFGARAGGSFLKKWFWFGDYEGTRINNPNPIFDRVPSAYDRSHLDEFIGQPGYQDGLIAQKVLALYPQSNVVAVPGVLEFYQGQAPNYTNVDNYLARLDFNQSDKSSWTVRYNLQDLHQLHDDTLPSSTIYPGNGSNTSALNQSLVLTFTHQFSQNLTNEARVGFTRFQVIETPQDQNFNASNIGLPSGPVPTFSLSGLDPQYAGASQGVPGGFAGWYNSFWASSLKGPYTPVTPSLDGLFPFAQIGAPLGSPGQRRDTEGQYVDNISLTKGRHYLRMGGGFQNLQNIFIADGFSRGLVVSSDIGEFTSDSATCNFPTTSPINPCPQSAFSNPSFDYALRQSAPYRGLFNSYIWSGYIQDTWRARSHLTVNLGLRYEYFSVPSETNNQIWNYDPAANGLVQQNHTQVLDPFSFNCALESYSQLDSVYPANAALLPWRCQPTASYNLKSSKANFGPRVGLAWSNADATTVIRGGYGIFYDQLPVSGIAQLMFNRPTPSNFTNPAAIYGQSFLSPYCGSMGQCGMGNSSLVSIDPSEAASQVATVPFGISAINAQQFRSPRSQQANVSIEQQVTQKLSLEIAYVGNFTSRIPAITNTGFNNEWFCTNSAGAPIPGEPNGTTNCDSFSYLPIQTLSDTAHGNYNAAIVQVHTRGWHGLYANAAYSFSKVLDNASQVNFSLIPTSLFNQIYALQFYGLANPSVFGIGNTTRFQVQGVTPPPSSSPPSLNTLLNAGLTTTGQGQVFATPYNIPQSPNNYLNNDYGRSDLNLTNRLVIDFAWNLPWRQSSKVLAGWTVSGIFIAESGQPFTIFTGPVGGELTQRADLAGLLPTTTGNPNAYIGQTNSISMPSLGCAAAAPANSYYVQGQTLFSGTAGTPCLGTSARNQFTGPAYVDFDTAVQKNIPVSERLNLILRAEFYNLFNRANYYNPITAYSLNGVTTNPQFGEIKSAHEWRRIQLAVRLNW